MNVTKLPKAELHAHLNGTIPPALTMELLSAYGIKTPEGLTLPNDLTMLEPVASLAEYFRPWTLLKKLPIGYECLRRMVDGAFAHLRTDNVAYVEFRNSPYNIADLNHISVADSLRWMRESFAEASERTSVDARLILSFSRYNFDYDIATQMLDAVEEVNQSRFIVGVDMSGDETQPVPLDSHRLFRRAKDELGLGVTIHAGECGSLENITWAINECRADRIGHGLAASTHPSTLDTLRDRNVCIEVCLQAIY